MAFISRIRPANSFQNSRQEPQHQFHIFINSGCPEDHIPEGESEAKSFRDWQSIKNNEALLSGQERQLLQKINAAFAATDMQNFNSHEQFDTFVEANKGALAAAANRIAPISVAHQRSKNLQSGELSSVDRTYINGFIGATITDPRFADKIVQARLEQILQRVKW